MSQPQGGAVYPHHSCQGWGHNALHVPHPEQHYAQSFALTTMLREIAAEENRADGTGPLVQPGQGFFALAGRLGKNTNDILRCWIKEVKRVQASLLLGQGPVSVGPNVLEAAVVG
jgi:hypothetical protein